MVRGEGGTGPACGHLLHQLCGEPAQHRRLGLGGPHVDQLGQGPAQQVAAVPAEVDVPGDAHHLLSPADRSHAGARVHGDVRRVDRLDSGLAAQDVRPPPVGDDYVALRQGYGFGAALGHEQTAAPRQDVHLELVAPPQTDRPAPAGGKTPRASATARASERGSANILELSRK